LLHSLGLVYKSMRGMVTNSIDRDQWLNVTSESRDRIQPFFIILNFALGRNRTRDPRVPEPKRTPLGYILPKMLLHSLGLVYKSMRGMMTNSIDRDQWLNVTSESRDRI
jgi:hypothetical protein